jgi:hypothetical protein
VPVADAGRKTRLQVSIWNCRLASKPVGQAWGWTLEGMECRRVDPDSTAADWELELYNCCRAACLPTAILKSRTQLLTEPLLVSQQFLYYICLCLVEWNASAFDKKWPQYAENKSLQQNVGRCARLGVIPDFVYQGCGLLRYKAV